MDEKEKLKLKRSLKSRHVTMVAIGGIIGTELFLRSDTAIQNAGPLMILSYLIVGIISFFMMRALGELILTEPDQHSFTGSVRKYLGNRIEFVVGWTYWLCWLSLAMADSTTTGVYLKYWSKDLPQWVGPLIIIVLLMLINMISVGLFGELESWFSTIKVLTILTLVATGLILLVMYSKINSRTASLSNLINYGGFFPTGSWGFLKSFQIVVFAFVGIETIDLTVGEITSPDKDTPKAINTLPVRIGLFYVDSIIVIMAVYLWNKIATTTSPFVQVLGVIEIPAAAGILNFVVLAIAMSTTSSAVFSTSRSLYALSRRNNAPKRFGKLSRKTIPSNALTFSSLVLLIVMILSHIMPAQISDIISSVSTVNFVMVWAIIMWTHLKYRAENKGRLGSLKMPGFPITNWVIIIFYLMILVILALIPATRLPLLISIIFILALALSCTLLERKN